METQESGKTVSPSQKQHYRSLSTPVAAGSFMPESETGLNLNRIRRTVVRCLPLLIFTTIGSMGLAYGWASTRPNAYKSSFDLLVRKSSAEGRLLSAVQQNQNSSTVNSDNPATLSDNTLLTILTSPKLLRQASEALGSQYPKLTYDVLKQGLILENPSQTDILRVSYTAADPKQVEQVLRVVSQAYLRYSLESQRTNIFQGVRFVEEQLPGLQSRVNYLQSQLQRFRQTYNLSDPNTQSEQLSTQLSSLNQLQYENQIALQENQASFNDLQRQFQSGNSYQLAASSLVRNSNYQKIRGQLLELDNQIARQSAILSDDHPGLIDLQQQRQRLIPLLDQEARQAIQEMGSSIRDLNARRQALAQTRTRLNQNMKQLSIQTREFNELQRELKIATDNLTQFLSKREALRIEAAQQQIPWELTTPPTLPELVQRHTTRTVALGGLLGLFLGLGIALLLDKIKNVFYSPDEVKAETNLPMLGVLPFAKEVRKRPVVKPDRKPFQTSPFYIEATRSLYTNIRLLNVDKPIHSLTVTSINPRDGKTTVAIHLARVAATLGQRVLLVDADLRKPQLHHALGLSNEQGLTDLMTSNLNIYEVLQTIHSEPSLFVLTSGQVPPDPVRLLTSEKMKHLTRRLEAAFDLVIYDTPPAAGLADATVMTTRTDGMVLVVGIENTERSDFSDTLEALSLSSTTVHGVVVNGWKSNHRKYHYTPRGKKSPPQLAQSRI
jgi:polysaccharide biosynthesis transport protein